MRFDAVMRKLIQMDQRHGMHSINKSEYCEQIIIHAYNRSKNDAVAFSF